MQSVRELSDINIEPIAAYLANNTTEFTSSQLYSAVTDKKFVDESLRKSRFRMFTDPNLFTLCDDLISKHLNKDDQDPYEYTLVRNDITHIMYGPEGFFKRHKDFRSLTSNVIEEFTLIVCVTPSEITTKGGETLLHFNSSFTHRSQSTITPGCALLFRKDLEHESVPITTGEKHIITMNIWATRRHSTQIFLVSFPATAQEPPNDENSLDSSDLERSRKLRKVAESQIYAIPVSNIMAFPNSMLAGYIRFLPPDIAANKVI